LPNVTPPQQLNLLHRGSLASIGEEQGKRDTVTNPIYSLCGLSNEFRSPGRCTVLCQSYPHLPRSRDLSISWPNLIHSGEHSPSNNHISNPGAGLNVHTLSSQLFFAFIAALAHLTCCFQSFTCEDSTPQLSLGPPTSSLSSLGEGRSETSIASLAVRPTLQELEQRLQIPHLPGWFKHCFRWWFR